MIGEPSIDGRRDTAVTAVRQRQTAIGHPAVRQPLSEVFHNLAGSKAALELVWGNQDRHGWRLGSVPEMPVVV